MSIFVLISLASVKNACKEEQIHIIEFVTHLIDNKGVEGISTDIFHIDVGLCAGLHKLNAILQCKLKDSGKITYNTFH